MTVGGARTLRAFHRFMRATSGVSAVEFALIIPILALMLVAMLEIGRTIHNRMVIDSVLRAGAHVAMPPPGERSDTEMQEQIKDSMKAASETILGAGASENDAIPLYACPEDFDGTADPLRPNKPNEPNECDEGPDTHYTFYRLEVSFEHSFLLLPDGILRLPGLRALDLSGLFNLSTSMLVQRPAQ